MQTRPHEKNDINEAVELLLMGPIFNLTQGHNII
jgi:hypothetical protein